MRESFKLRLVRGARQLVIKGAPDDTGLVVEGEDDAFPRKFYLEFDTRSSVTSMRMRNVQRINGWHPWEFRLKMSLTDDSCLVFRGANPRSLPSGHYWIKPRIEDLELAKGKRIKLALDESGETVLDVEAREDDRRVVLTKTVSQWDEEMRRIATADGLDDKPMEEWLTGDEAREQRKSCLLNILSVLRARSFEDRSLLHEVQSVFFAGVDRIYTRTSADLYRVVDQLSKARKSKFFYEGRPKSTIHEKLLERAAKRFWASSGNLNARELSLRGLTQSPDRVRRVRGGCESALR